MHKRRYGLFRRLRVKPLSHRWTWEQIGCAMSSKQAAVECYQSQLIANATGSLEPGYEYRLRPVFGLPWVRL